MRETIEVDRRFMAILLKRLGGEVEISVHEMQQIHPETVLSFYSTERPLAWYMTVMEPDSAGAIDAEFTVVR